MPAGRPCDITINTDPSPQKRSRCYPSQVPTPYIIFQMIHPSSLPAFLCQTICKHHRSRRREVYHDACGVHIPPHTYTGKYKKRKPALSVHVSIFFFIKCATKTSSFFRIGGRSVNTAELVAKYTVMPARRTCDTTRVRSIRRELIKKDHHCSKYTPGRLD